MGHSGVGEDFKQSAQTSLSVMWEICIHCQTLQVSQGAAAVHCLSPQLWR